MSTLVLSFWWMKDPYMVDFNNATKFILALTLLVLSKYNQPLLLSYLSI